MADTDIRCHGARGYSGCSVMCNNTSVCDLSAVVVVMLCKY